MPQANFDDFAEITRRVYEYALGIDTRDFELYRSIFTDSVAMNFYTYSGQPELNLQADEWVANGKALFIGLEATQHSMSNPMVDVVGDVGRCRMYMQAAHFLAEDLVPEGSGREYTIGGYYDDRLVRTDEGWKIEAVTLNVLWHRGNREIMEIAAGA